MYIERQLVEKSFMHFALDSKNSAKLELWSIYLLILVMLDTPILYISLDANLLEEKVRLLDDNRPLFLVTTECHFFFCQLR